MAEKLDLDRLEAKYSKMVKLATQNFVARGNQTELRRLWEELSGAVPLLIAELKDARAIEAATDTIIDGWRWEVEEERKLNRKLEAEVARLKASGIIGTGKRDEPAGT